MNKLLGMLFLCISLFGAQTFSIGDNQNRPETITPHKNAKFLQRVRFLDYGDNIPKPKHDSTTLILNFKTTDPAEIQALLSQFPIKKYKILKHFKNIVICHFKDGVDIDLIKKELEKTGLIKNSSYNYEVAPESLTNDPLIDKQWYFGTTGDSEYEVNISTAWDKTKGSDDIVVAVLDTGIALHHEDLEDNIWINEDELNGEEGVDDDDNGYVDDIYGYDFAYDLDGNTAPVPNAIGSHGSMVAGFIGAVGDNGIGVTGINQNIKIMALKVYTPSGSGSTTYIFRAIDYVLAMKEKGVNIVAVNASLGYYGGDPDNSPFKDMIEKLQQAGILFVASAGNAGYDNDLIYYDYGHFPSSFNVDSILAVASTGYKSKDRASFSCYGKRTVQVGTAGYYIKSTNPLIEGNDTNDENFTDDFEANNLDKWSDISGDWNTTDSDSHMGTYSLTDSPDGDYDDSTDPYIITQDINLTDTNNTPLAVDFCMKNDLAYGDYLQVYFYDKNSDQYYKMYYYGDTSDEWKCVGVLIPEYYKTDSFKVKFVLYTNGDGNVGDGVFIDDVKVGTYENSNSYESGSGTSYAAPIVAGAYALYTSDSNEDMYTKISKIIGNSIPVDYTTHGLLDIGYVFDGPVPPFIFNARVVRTIYDNPIDEYDEVNVSVVNPSSSPKFYIGGVEAKYIKIDDNNFTVKIPAENPKNTLIVQAGDVNSSNTLYLSKWELIARAPKKHLLGTRAFYNGKIYLFDGIDGDNFNDVIDIYNVVDNSWDTGSSDDSVSTLSTGKKVGDNFYIFGGLDSDGNYLTKVKIYDFVNDSWSSGADLPQNFYAASSAVVDNNVYIIGGADDNGELNTTYKYDVVNDSFEELADMNVARAQVATCVFNDKIYTFGGLNDNTATSDAEVYDVANNSWQNIATLPKKITSSVCKNIDNKFIVIFGGVDENNNTINSVIKYYPDTNSYEEIDQSILLPYLPLEGDYLVEDNETNVTYYVGGYLHNSPVKGTATIEKIDTQDFLPKEIPDPVVISTPTQQVTTNNDSDNSGSLPAFDIFTLLLMLGGALLIIRRKA